MDVDDDVGMFVLPRLPVEVALITSKAEMFEENFRDLLVAWTVDCPESEDYTLWWNEFWCSGGRRHCAGYVTL